MVDATAEELIEQVRIAEKGRAHDLDTAIFCPYCDKEIGILSVGHQFLLKPV